MVGGPPREGRRALPGLLEAPGEEAEGEEPAYPVNPSLANPARRPLAWGGWELLGGRGGAAGASRAARAEFGSSRQASGIPHLLHQVFLDGREALEAEEQKEEEKGKAERRFDRRWRESCAAANPGWRVVFWDEADAEALLAERYPWFLPTFRAYPRVVLRGDALRPFLLHAFGGLYLDVDVECFARVDHSLQGADLVLQMEDKGAKSLNNAVMASTAGHPLWGIMQRLLHQRAPDLLHAHNTSRSVKELSVAVLYATGPWALRDAFKEWTGEAGSLARGYAGDHLVHRSHVRVYPLGQWYTPCHWHDPHCHALVDAASRAHTLPRGVVGHHKNSGTWLKAFEGESRGSWLRAWAPLLALGAALLVLGLFVLLHLAMTRGVWRRGEGDPRSSRSSRAGQRGSQRYPSKGPANGGQQHGRWWSGVSKRDVGCCSQQQHHAYDSGSSSLSPSPDSPSSRGAARGGGPRHCVTVSAFSDGRPDEEGEKELL